MCLLHRPAAKTISDVWRWRRQGERKERETNCRMGGTGAPCSFSHCRDSPQIFFQLQWFGSKRNKTDLRGVVGNLKMFTSILQASKGPFPSCYLSLSVVKIYHSCAPTTSSCWCVPPGEGADISVRWSGALSVTVNWLWGRLQRDYCAGRSDWL